MIQEQMPIHVLLCRPYTRHPPLKEASVCCIGILGNLQEWSELVPTAALQLVLLGVRLPHNVHEACRVTRLSLQYLV